MAPGTTTTRRAGVLTALLLAMALWQGCGFHYHQRGSVREVQATRKARAVGLEARAVRLEDGSVEVRLAERQRVTVRQRRIYNTVTWSNSYNPGYAALELLISPLALPIYTIKAFLGPLPDLPDIDSGIGQKLEVIVSPINPFQTLLGDYTPEVVDEVRFKDRPVVLEHEELLPVRGVALRCQALSARGAVLVDETIITDRFGRVSLTAPPEATHLRATCPGLEIDVPIEAPHQ